MAIGNGFACSRRSDSLLPPGFPASSAWMGTQTGRGPTSRLALRRLCLQQGSCERSPGWSPRSHPDPRRASRAAPVAAVPRGHGSCPKQVTLISPVSDGETETGSSAVTLRGTQGPAPANSPLPKGGRRLPLLGQSRLNRARARAKILPECSAQPKSKRLHKRHHTCREQRGTHAPIHAPAPRRRPLNPSCAAPGPAPTGSGRARGKAQGRRRCRRVT